MSLTRDTRDRPVFLCGHPKSGTSLLRALLDGHPQLVVYPEETLFFRRFLPRAQGKDRQSLLSLAEETLIHIFRWNIEAPPLSQEGFPDRDYSAIPFERVREEMNRLLEERFSHMGDVLSAAVLAYGLVAGQYQDRTRAWVEKSPYNEFYAHQIFAWWPQGRCIHIVRDPRDTFVSYRRKHPEWDAEFLGANWQRSARAGFANQRRYGAERYLLLRYEDLIQTPQEVLRHLAAFLEIDWDVVMVSPTRAGLPWAGNSMFSERFQAISQAPLGRWKTALEPAEARAIEAMAFPTMHRLGYPCPSLRGLNGIARRAYALTWRLRRHLHRFSEPFGSVLAGLERDDDGGRLDL